MSADDVVKWADGKNLLLVFMAWEIIGHSDVLCDGINLMICGKKMGQFPAAPAPCEMVKCYRKRKEIFDGLFVIAGLSEEQIGICKVLCGAFREFTRKSAEEKKKLLQEAASDEEVRKAYAEMAKGMNEQVLPTAIGAMKDAIEGETEFPESMNPQNASNADVQFLMRVMFPCWICYGVNPKKLFASARRGNIESLEKLLRLDKSALFEPRIAEEFYKCSQDGRSGRFARLSSAVKGSPRPVRPRALKLALAGLMKTAAKALGLDLTAPEIQRLFDAWAGAWSKGKRKIDTDLPDDPETFAREVRIKRDHWARFFGPGK